MVQDRANQRCKTDEKSQHSVCDAFSSTVLTFVAVRCIDVAQSAIVRIFCMLPLPSFLLVRYRFIDYPYSLGPASPPGLDSVTAHYPSSFWSPVRPQHPNHLNKFRKPDAYDESDLLLRTTAKVGRAYRGVEVQKHLTVVTLTCMAHAFRVQRLTKQQGQAQAL